MPARRPAESGWGLGAELQQPFFGPRRSGSFPAVDTEPGAGLISSQPGTTARLSAATCWHRGPPLPAMSTHGEQVPGRSVQPATFRQQRFGPFCPLAPLPVLQPPGGELRHEGPLHPQQGQIPDPRLEMRLMRQAGVRGPGG